MDQKKDTCKRLPIWDAFHSSRRHAFFGDLPNRWKDETFVFVDTLKGFAANRLIIISCEKYSNIQRTFSNRRKNKMMCDEL